MKRFLAPALFALSLPLLHSCQSIDVAEAGDVNQNKIWQTYRVEIDDEHDRAEAEAQFRFGGSTGTTLNLTSPSSLELNGQEMQGDDRFLRGFVYDKQIDRSETEFQFVFTNADEEKLTNTIPLQPIELANVPDELDGNSSIEINWTGAPIGKNETVMVLVVDGEGMATTLASTSTKGAKTIKIRAKDIKRQLINGSGSIQLEREFSSGLQEGTDEGGLLQGIYSSESQGITIINAREPIPDQQYETNSEENATEAHL